MRKFPSPLSWRRVHKDWWQAQTPFGSYSVDLDVGGKLQLRWCFDEYYDEGSERVDSVEDGKARAQKDWDNRVAPILRAYEKTRK